MTHVKLGDGKAHLKKDGHGEQNRSKGGLDRQRQIDRLVGEFGADLLGRVGQVGPYKLRREQQNGRDCLRCRHVRNDTE